MIKLLGKSLIPVTSDERQSWTGLSYPSPYPSPDCSTGTAVDFRLIPVDWDKGADWDKLSQSKNQWWNWSKMAHFWLKNQKFSPPFEKTICKCSNTQNCTPIFTEMILILLKDQHLTEIPKGDLGKKGNENRWVDGNNTGSILRANTTTAATVLQITNVKSEKSAK